MWRQIPLALFIVYGMIIGRHAHCDPPTAAPKWFGVDIDGTFYTGNEESMEKNIEAFKKAKDCGYTLFFCTGKFRHSSISRIGHKFGERTRYHGCPGVYANGAIVLDEQCAPIKSATFPKEFLSSLFDYIKSHRYEEHFSFTDGLYRYRLKRDSPSNNATDSVQNGSVAGLSAADLKWRDIIAINISYNLNFEKIAAVFDDIAYTIMHTVSAMTIMLAGVNKASGVLLLAEHYRVPLTDIGFIGDGANDIEVMKMCRVSYAVGNASDDVKRAAKHVLNETCDEAAFAKAMSLVYSV